MQEGGQILADISFHLNLLCYFIVQKDLPITAVFYGSIRIDELAEVISSAQWNFRWNNGN